MSAVEIPDEKLKDFFDQFDVDGSGVISKAEVKNALERMGLDEDTVTNIAKNIMVDSDHNNDEKITFEEFKAGVRK